MARNNKSKKNKSPTLDLHGFKSDEVFDAVDRFIVGQEKKGSSRAKIMTGKGKGIVQKAVIDYLKRAGYPWKYEKLENGKPNPGVLDVFLD